MEIKKGDLVLVSKGDTTRTCIILTDKDIIDSHGEYEFYYTYCLETGLYGLVYIHEITSMVSHGFAPDFEFHSEIFDTNYSYYAELYERFSYFPAYYPADYPSIAEDTEEDDTKEERSVHDDHLDDEE